MQEEHEGSQCWVQCDACQQWRNLPGCTAEEYEKVQEMKRWTCSMNRWDRSRSHCSQPEENYNKTSPLSLRSSSIPLTDSGLFSSSIIRNNLVNGELIDIRPRRRGRQHLPIAPPTPSRSPHSRRNNRRDSLGNRGRPPASIGGAGGGQHIKRSTLLASTDKRLKTVASSEFLPEQGDYKQRKRVSLPALSKRLSFTVEKIKNQEYIDTDGSNENPKRQKDSNKHSSFNSLSMLPFKLEKDEGLIHHVSQTPLSGERDINMELTSPIHLAQIDQTITENQESNIYSATSIKANIPPKRSSLVLDSSRFDLISGSQIKKMKFVRESGSDLVELTHHGTTEHPVPLPFYKHDTSNGFLSPSSSSASSGLSPYCRNNQLISINKWPERVQSPSNQSKSSSISPIDPNGSFAVHPTKKQNGTLSSVSSFRTNFEDTGIGTGPTVRWAQCDICEKWRRLPGCTEQDYAELNNSQAPWRCSLNKWDKCRASCSAPEELLTPIDNISEVNSNFDDAVDVGLSDVYHYLNDQLRYSDSTFEYHNGLNCENHCPMDQNTCPNNKNDCSTHDHHPRTQSSRLFDCSEFPLTGFHWHDLPLSVMQRIQHLLMLQREFVTNQINHTSIPDRPPFSLHDTIQSSSFSTSNQTLPDEWDICRLLILKHFLRVTPNLLQSLCHFSQYCLRLLDDSFDVHNSKIKDMFPHYHYTPSIPIITDPTITVPQKNKQSHSLITHKKIQSQSHDDPSIRMSPTLPDHNTLLEHTVTSENVVDALIYLLSGFHQDQFNKQTLFSNDIPNFSIQARLMEPFNQNESQRRLNILHRIRHLPPEMICRIKELHSIFADLSMLDSTKGVHTAHVVRVLEFINLFQERLNSSVVTSDLSQHLLFNDDFNIQQEEKQLLSLYNPHFGLLSDEKLQQFMNQFQGASSFAIQENQDTLSSINVSLFRLTPPSLHLHPLAGRVSLSANMQQIRASEFFPGIISLHTAQQPPIISRSVRTGGSTNYNNYHVSIPSQLSLGDSRLNITKGIPQLPNTSIDKFIQKGWIHICLPSILSRSGYQCSPSNTVTDSSGSHTIGGGHPSLSSIQGTVSGGSSFMSQTSTLNEAFYLDLPSRIPWPGVDEEDLLDCSSVSSVDDMDSYLNNDNLENGFIIKHHPLIQLANNGGDHSLTENKLSDIYCADNTRDIISDSDNHFSTSNVSESTHPMKSMISNLNPSYLFEFNSNNIFHERWINRCQTIDQKEYHLRDELHRLTNGLLGGFSHQHLQQSSTTHLPSKLKNEQIHHYHTSDIQRWANYHLGLSNSLLYTTNPLQSDRQLRPKIPYHRQYSTRYNYKKERTQSLSEYHLTTHPIQTHDTQSYSNPHRFQLSSTSLLDAEELKSIPNDIEIPQILPSKKSGLKPIRPTTRYTHSTKRRVSGVPVSAMDSTVSDTNPSTSHQTTGGGLSDYLRFGHYNKAVTLVNGPMLRAHNLMHTTKRKHWEKGRKRKTQSSSDQDDNYLHHLEYIEQQCQNHLLKQLQLPPINVNHINEIKKNNIHYQPKTSSLNQKTLQKNHISQNESLYRQTTLNELLSNHIVFDVCSLIKHLNKFIYNTLWSFKFFQHIIFATKQQLLLMYPMRQQSDDIFLKGNHSNSNLKPTLTDTTERITRELSNSSINRSTVQHHESHDESLIMNDQLLNPRHHQMTYQTNMNEYKTPIQHEKKKLIFPIPSVHQSLNSHALPPPILIPLSDSQQIPLESTQIMLLQHDNNLEESDDVHHVSREPNTLETQPNDTQDIASTRTYSIGLSPTDTQPSLNWELCDE